jgi:hypothetical protein
MSVVSGNVCLMCVCVCVRERVSMTMSNVFSDLYAFFFLIIGEKFGKLSNSSA